MLRTSELGGFSEAPDETSSLYEQVLNDIFNGVLVGGQRLKVAELAKRYGVSTSPVREVLRQMQGEGFVEISHNRGATVKKVDAGAIQNIFEILQLLEPYFVIWFADYAQPEMVDELEAIQAEIAETPESDLVTFRRLDGEFHWAICKRHYNKLAADAWRRYRRALIVYGANLRISPTRFRKIMEEHTALIAAFRANDVEQAARVIRAHVAGSGEQMLQQMRVLGIER